MKHNKYNIDWLMKPSKPNARKPRIKFEAAEMQIPKELRVPQITWKAKLLDDNGNPVAHIYKKEDQKTMAEIEQEVNQYIFDYNHYNLVLSSPRSYIGKYTIEIVNGSLL